MLILLYVGSPCIIMTTLKKKAKDTIDKATDVVKETITITKNGKSDDDNHRNIDTEFISRGDTAGGLTSKKKGEEEEE